MNTSYTIKSFVAAILLLAFCAAKSFGQLQVSVAVSPPYSVYLEDYLQMGSNTLIVVTNTTSQPIQFKLVPSIANDDGGQLSINPNFQPAAPISIGANQTLTLTGSQLNAYNGNYNNNDISASGISKEQLLQQGVLPEGNYTLCIEAYSFANSTLLTAGNSCSNFFITHYDPPIMVYPAYDGEVQETTPQLVTFNWTPTGIPAYTRYELQIVDMNLNQLFNPNDAFGNLGVQLLYKQDLIPTNNTVYTIANPPLTPGHTYALRVIAKDPTKTIAFKNNGIGPVSTFKYVAKQAIFVSQNNFDLPLKVKPDTTIVLAKIKNLGFKLNSPNNQQNQLPPPPENCGDDCSLPPVQGAAQNPQNGVDITAGYFNITNVLVNGNSGTGKVFLPFLKAHLAVKWNNIKVNAQGQLKTGEIYADVTPGSVIDQNIAQNPDADLSTAYENLQSLNNEVAGFGKKVSQLTGNEPPTKLPISLDNKSLDLIIAGIIFEPQMAKLNMLAGIEIPESALNDMLGISQSGIGIQPNGFCSNSELKLFLNQNAELNLSNAPNPVKIKFNSGVDKTSIAFDCQGPKTLKIDGEFIFPEEKLVAVDAEGDELPNTKVRIPFSYSSSENFKDWILENLSTVPAHFSFPATKGFVFSAQNLVYDHHATSSASGMVFHTNHPNHPANGTPNSKLWQGFYLQNLSVTFPKGFNKNGEDIVVSAQEMLIDKSGFWGTASIQNILTPQEDGSLGGWKFSVAELALDFEASTLTGGSFSGGIELPISDMPIDYQVPLNGGDDFNFQVELGEDYALNMWLATLNLADNSTVSITKQGNKFVPAASLNGSITVDWNKQSTANLPNDKKPMVGNFTIPKLDFQDFKIETLNNLPKITGIKVGLDIPNLDQAKMLNIPISLDAVYVNTDNPTQVGLGMKLSVNFGGGDNGISGGTDIMLKSNLENLKFKYEGVQLSSVSIDIETSMAILKGQIDVFQDNPEYGNGFRGFIYAKIIPIGAEVNLTLQVGKTTGNNGFKYWMFDAGYRADVGIPMGAVALYGLGGGGYYNMVREEVALNINELENIDANSFDQVPGAASNGIKFTPEQGGFGFSASAVIGLVGSAAAFNADLKFGIDFYDGGSVDKIYFNGKGFLMQSMSSRDGDATLQGTCNIEVVMAKPNDPTRPRFTVDVAILINIASIAEVQATANMYFSPNDWYVYFGKWSEEEVYNDRINLNIDLPVVEADLSLNAYFMMGSSLPANLPPLPPEITKFFGNPKVSQKGQNKTSKPQPTANMGFAFGFMAQLDVSLEVAIIYADIDFILGVDALLTNVEGAECNGKSDFGINNWYAKGQAYAYVNIEAGLMLDVWFWQGKAPLAQITAGALLQFQGPNPLWIAGQLKIEGSILGGLIELNTSIYAEVGEKCGDEFGSPFDDIPIVSYTGPEDKDSEVHVFRDPEIVFNYPNEPFILEAVNKEGEVEMRAFSYTLHKYKYSYKDAQNKTKTIPTKQANYADDGYSCYVSPLAPLPELTAVTYRIEARGYEHQMNGNAVLNNKAPACPMQVTEGTFETDSLPDVIIIDDVLSTVPALGQQYFLKGSFPQGSVAMSNAECSHLFRTESLTDANEEFVYKAKFTAVRNNTTYEADCNCANKIVTFNVPQELKNSHIYKLEIVRIGQPKQDKVVESENEEAYKTIGGSEGNAPKKMILNLPESNPKPKPNKGISQLKIKAPKQNPNPKYQQGILNLNPPPKPKIGTLNKLVKPPGPKNPGLNLNIKAKTPKKMIELDIYDRQLVGEVQQVKTSEKVLFTYHFKTSKYNSLNSKAADMKPAGYMVKNYEIPGIHAIGMENSEDEVNIPVMFLEATEGFDQYDLYGIWYNEPEEYGGNINKFIPPILNFEKSNSLTFFDGYYKTAYDKSQAALFFNQDAEDYRYKNELWDPYNYEFELSYEDLNLPSQFQDLKQFIVTPNWLEVYFEFVDWNPYRYNGGNSGNRFGYTLETKKYELPDHSDHIGNGLPYEYLPIEVYVQPLHGNIDFDGKNVLQLEGKLTNSQIAEEKAKGKQMGAGNKVANNSKSYIAMLDYSEYLAKRDHIYLTNQILYRLRDNMCMNCGSDPGKVPPGGVVDFMNLDPGLKGQDGLLNWVQSQPYTFEFIPMRSFLLNHKAYKPRKKGEVVYFGLGNTGYEFVIDQQLNTENWKYQLPIMPF
jgi:hypothetical protein